MPASADPELAMRLAKEVADLYGQAVDRMLAIVARRLASGIDRPGWAERKLAEVVALRNEARAVVDRLAVLGPEAVTVAITEAVEVGAAQAARDLAGEVTATFGRTSTEAVDALARETITALQSTHGQILRSTLDAYRQVIAEASGGTVTGVDTRRQAAQRALDRFAERGVTGLVDRAGRRWSIDTYSEMATRTAVGRSQVAGALERYQQAGRDLVIVSDAPQECRLCLVPGTVVEGPVPEWRARTEYAGDIVSITTASGKHLAGTPDHSVLTPFGWRRLQDLHPGDEVVSDLGEHEVAGVVPDHVQVPALIEEAGEAFAPLLLAGPARRDLDGDRSYREVRAVWPDGDLLTERLPALGEPLRHLDLVGAVGARATFPGQCDAAALLDGTGTASGCAMCWIEQGGPLLDRGLGPAALHGGGAVGTNLRRVPLAFGGGQAGGFASGSSLNASPAEIVRDHPTADAEGGAQLLRALSGEVALDEILSVGWRQFRGHVWDLSTGPGWFLANGIVTHNCRPWEGRILSITGASPGYPTVSDATSAGLHHAACRHSLSLFTPGLTRRMTNTEDPEGDAARQEQRRLERGVRLWKRRQLVAMDADARRNATNHVRSWQARLKEHVDSHGLKRQRQREVIGRAR